MRIFGKGFNLYGQLNGTDYCVAEYQEIFKSDCIEHFEITHTFSVIFAENKLKVNCNLVKKQTIDLIFSGKIKQVSVNDKMLLILNDSGQLFKASTDNWQISPMPKFVEDSDQINIIGSNSKLNVAYAESGALYNIPEKLDFSNKDIIDVKTGREHCVLLDKLGNVYTFGAGSRGQLGTGMLNEEPNPILVQALAGVKISKIAAGGWHSAALSEEGDLYTWGWNGNGQLGLADLTKDNKGQTVSVMATPQVVDIQDCSENHIIDIACGSKHTIALLDNNTLYGCGWNKYKQLKNDNQENYHAFICIHDFSQENVDRIVCGPWNSAVHDLSNNEVKN